MDTFTALADPTRRQIIESLAAGETSFGELADKFEMSRPAVSQHLKVLRDAGIVTARADAQRRISAQCASSGQSGSTGSSSFLARQIKGERL
jgi:DNA-binding transcriptional ArsR family regulator